MTITRIGVGPRMSQAVVHAGKVHTAGIVADSAAGKGVTEQTADILAQIDALLAQAGSDKTKIIKANIWITDMGRFAEMNAAWDAWVPQGHTPARATVESRLAGPQYAVEIMVEAAI